MCPAHAQVTETVLNSFLGGSDGFAPYAPVIADMSKQEGSLRALYGTTGYGGAVTAPNCVVPAGDAGGCDTVFNLTLAEYGQTPWAETVLARFTGGTDGAFPYAGLLARKDPRSQTTSFYGTTSGLTPFGIGTSPGTVFKVSGQTLTTIYNFTGGSDGSQPVAGVTADEAAGAPGPLYGTAGEGGSNNCGTVYRLMPPKDDGTAWTEQTLWKFFGGGDGCTPTSPPLVDERGALYGTTAGGGTSGNGTVFKPIPPRADQTAWSEQIVWSFSGGSDGGSPFLPGSSPMGRERSTERRVRAAPQTTG